MYNIGFEWNDKKSKSNITKHGVSFEEASSIFRDESAIEFYDDAHSDWEERFLLLGLSNKLNLLLVCHCYKETNGIIRIISARKATKTESQHYER
jgi:uncharacterized DUF497 family protein